MAVPWPAGSYTKICLAAALVGSVGLAIYYGYRKGQQSSEENASENEKVGLLKFDHILMFYLE